MAFHHARKDRCLSASRLLTLLCLVIILFKITGNQSITLGRLVLKRVIFVLFSMLQATCNVNTLRSEQIFTFTLIIKVHHRIKLRWLLIPTHECHLFLSPVRYWALIYQAVLTALPWDCFASHSCSLSRYRMTRCAYHSLSDNCVFLRVLNPCITPVLQNSTDTVNPFNKPCCI